MGSLFHVFPKCRKPLFVEGKSSQPGASQTDGEIAFACKSSAPLHWQGRRKRGKTEVRFTPWRQRAPNGQFYCFCPIRLDTVDKSVVLWYNEEKRTGVFFHGEQLSTARYVRCDVGNSQAVHNRKQGNVGRERKGYPSISEWRVLDFENGSTMERPAAGIW